VAGTTVVFIVVGITALILLRALSTKAQPAPAATKQPPAQWNRPDVPRIARRGNPMTVEDDIVQSDDGKVFVHAGRGSFTAFPPSSKSGGDAYQFGIRPPPGKRTPEAMAGVALTNRDSRQRLNLTPEQQQQLDALGPYPQPPKQVKDQIIDLFEVYAAADESARPAALKPLLDAVHQYGDSFAPTVDQWQASRYEVLTPEQRLLAQPTAKRATTLPALER
jgi:hypothetical protein